MMERTKKRMWLIILSVILLLGAGCVTVYGYDDYDDEDYEPVHTHSFERTREQEATCGVDGTDVIYCYDCGYEEYVTIPATGNHKWEQSYVEKESCTKNWTAHFECSSCGMTKTAALTPTGHNYTDWYVWSTVSCSTEGKKTRECQICYDYQTKITPATGHNYKTTLTKATKSKDGSSVKKCTKCKDIKSYITIYKPSRIKLSKTKYTYDGKKKTPKVKVYNSQGKLIPSSHYSVSYAKGRKAVGKYKVTVTFKKSSKKYKGKMTTSFKINPQSTKLLKVTKGKEAFTAKWKKKTSQVSGYQIRYSRWSDMYGAYTETVSGKNSSKLKVTGLWGEELYYVQVRTYKTVDGKKFYSSWSSKKTVTTKSYVTDTDSYDDSSDSGNNDYTYVDNEPSGTTVYVTATGTKYHYSQYCKGLSNASAVWKVSLSKAKNSGLSKCKYE